MKRVSCGCAGDESMLTEQEKRELQDTITSVLKTLGDLADIEKRITALKKGLDKLYISIDSRLDKGQY